MLTMLKMNRRQFLQSSTALAAVGTCSPSWGVATTTSHSDSRILLRGMGGWGRHIVSQFAQCHPDAAQKCLIEMFDRTDVLGLQRTGFPFAAVSGDESGVIRTIYPRIGEGAGGLAYVGAPVRVTGGEIGRLRPITPQLSIREISGEILMYVGALGRVTGGGWSCEFAEYRLPRGIRQYGVFLLPSRAKPPRYDLGQMAMYDRAVSHLSRLQGSLDRSVFIHLDDFVSADGQDQESRVEAHAVKCIAELLA